VLRVKIELVPHGIEDAKRTLTEVCIVNDGTGDADVGNYDIYLDDVRDGWIGRIENFPRYGEQRSRDRLAALALDLARGTQWDGWVDRTEMWDKVPVDVKPGGWVVMRGCKRTHLLMPDGRTRCRHHWASRVFCREGEFSPLRCRSCAR
jgi:hypothetical protein